MKPYYLVIIAAASLAGCSKNDTPATPTTPATCGYTVSSTSQSPSSAGGAISVTVTRTSGSCTWAASSNASWLTFLGPSSASDTATLTMNIAANASTSTRGGTVTISWNGGTAQIAVNQSGLPFGQCIYSFAAPTLTIPAAGGPSSAALVVTGTGCSWTASVDAAWLSITSQTSGAASSAIAFTALPNPDSIERGGSLTAAFPGGTTKVSITQSGVTSCSYTLSPSSQSATSAGGAFSFVPTRNTLNGCAFSASTAAAWITFTSPTSGLSGATVTYTVAANSGAARTATIDVGWSGGDTQLTVSQSAAGSIVAKRE